MVDFADRIKLMNSMYKLASNDTPTLPANVVDRITKFKRTMVDEINELDEIIENHNNEEEQKQDINVMVEMADLLGDIVVYCRSEALKYGIPLEEVLSIIMDSNESKLDSNGEPIYNDDGKFLKGPFYWAPEEKIKELLLSKGPVIKGTWN